MKILALGLTCVTIQEFEESGDPENHFQALLSVAKEGIEKGKVVAVGECGLDYDRLHFCSSEIQKKYVGSQKILKRETMQQVYVSFNLSVAHWFFSK